MVRHYLNNGAVRYDQLIFLMSKATLKHYWHCLVGSRIIVGAQVNHPALHPGQNAELLME